MLETAVGYDALGSLTDSAWNTAVGALALVSNRGDQNTAVGYAALSRNTNGWGNTANGYSALEFNTNGAQNTASGHPDKIIVRLVVATEA